MKKTLTLLLFSCFSLGAAATNITTSTVSGHWTSAGSPYHILNNITVPAGQSLTIDPGVEIVFDGFYSLTISGAVKSSGTSSLPIVYRANDTSGWFNRYSVSGGWSGIKYQSSDSAVFEHCTLSNMKFASNSSGYGFVANGGKVTLSMCNFYNNSVYFDSSSVYALNALFSFTFCIVSIKHCKFYNNYSKSDLLNIFHDYLENKITITDCEFNDNTAGGHVIRIAGNSVDFKNNKVFGNTTDNGIFYCLSNFTSFSENVSVCRNRFYQNMSHNAAINCEGGHTLIENNYVCNNRNDESVFCGETGGGGGIRVSNAGSNDTFTFIIRNNIVANNFSTYAAGGIHAAGCNAEIINNTVVNNNCPFGGGIYAWVDTAITRRVKTNRLTIRNNIFYGNVFDGAGTTRDIKLYAASMLYFAYDHNWMQKSFVNNALVQHSATGTVEYLSDTSANFIGAVPGMNNPTNTANVNESALSADFSLVALSQCINAGVVVPNLGYNDYADNYRIYGLTVDIGAYEYGASPFPMSAPCLTSITKMKLYPNPATSSFFISTSDAVGSIYLQDISGRRVADRPVTAITTTFDVYDLPRGVYFAVWNNGRDQNVVEKIILE